VEEAINNFFEAMDREIVLNSMTFSIKQPIFAGKKMKNFSLWERGCALLSLSSHFYFQMKQYI